MREIAFTARFEKYSPCRYDARGEFELMTLEDYVETIVNQLEVFSEETVIQRLTGDGGRDSLVGPLWSLKKFVVLNEIDKLMVKRDTYQGVKYGE